MEWEGKKNEERLRGAIQWGSDKHSPICATGQCRGWRGVWEIQPGKGEGSRVLSKKRPLMRMKPQSVEVLTGVNSALYHYRDEQDERV